jgi:hypothetical protein
MLQGFVGALMSLVEEYLCVTGGAIFSATQ